MNLATVLATIGLVALAALLGYIVRCYEESQLGKGRGKWRS